MKIPINLASQPFRRDRAIVAASVLVSVLLVISLGALVWLAMQDRSQLADVRAEVARLNREIQRLSADQGRMDAILRKPENAQVLEQTVFLNTLLVRKAISWTQIFADLEKVIPYNVRIVQIHPSVSPQDQVSLDIQVASESMVPVIQMFQTLQESPKFSYPDVKVLQSPTQSEPIYKCRVSVDYAQKL